MKVFSATDIGQKRQMNQDFIYTSEEPVGNLPNLFAVSYTHLDVYKRQGQDSAYGCGYHQRKGRL